MGTLQPRKNLARLVQAFAPVAAQHPGLQLVLAGKKGWMYDEIFAQVRRLGLEDRVVFTGYVAAEDLPALYSGALAFAFPSLYEGFGMPVLEAMACGAPGGGLQHVQPAGGGRRRRPAGGPDRRGRPLGWR